MRSLTWCAGFVVLMACQSRESPAQQQATRPGAERRDTALARQFRLHPTLGGKLRAPEGLEVDYFAKNTGSVRFMVLGPDGAVYASRPGEGDIIRLADTYCDGTAD